MDDLDNYFQGDALGAWSPFHSPGPSRDATEDPSSQVSTTPFSATSDDFRYSQSPDSPRLSFMPLDDWCEDVTYDQSQPTCIGYAKEWKLTFNRRLRAKGTELDVNIIRRNSHLPSPLLRGPIWERPRNEQRPSRKQPRQPRPSDLTVLLRAARSRSAHQRPRPCKPSRHSIAFCALLVFGAQPIAMALRGCGVPTHWRWCVNSLSTASSPNTKIRVDRTKWSTVPPIQWYREQRPSQEIVRGSPLEGTP